MKNIALSILILCSSFYIFCNNEESTDNISNSYLSNIEISYLSPTFSPEVFNYESIFPSYPKSVQVKATANVPQATITINGTIVQSDSSFQVQLSGPPQDIITIIVKSHKGEFTSSYTVTIKGN